MAMPALSDYMTGGNVKSSKQGGSAMSDVVMGDSLHVPKTHRQQRLGLFKSLHLGLLVNAEHNCLVRWVQVEADDVPDLLDKEWICRDFECLLAMGLEGECFSHRCTVLLEIPVSAARERALHWVLPSLGFV